MLVVTLQHKPMSEPSFLDFQVLTVRVHRLPADLDRAHVPTFLSDSVWRLGPADNISVLSLTSTPGDWGIPPSRTVTLQFDTHLLDIIRFNSVDAKAICEYISSRLVSDC
jgi:hypothetical protein